MKILKGVLALALVSTVFFSCKKDSISEPTQPTATFEGKWVGHYDYGDNGQKYYFCLYFKSGGVIEEYSSSGKLLGSGTWKMDTNKIITAEWVWPSSSKKYFIVAAYYPSDKQILGDWGYSKNAVDGGTFELEK
jgi:hypothetical protein